MKKLFLPIAFALVISACGNSKDSKDTEKTTENTSSNTESLSDNPDYKKGLGLVAKYKCMVCHSVDEKVTGPAYREVANKYAGTSDTMVNYLANKIIAGGKGNWGEIAMTPHPTVTKEEAEAMVKYVLLLKK